MNRVVAVGLVGLAVTGALTACGGPSGSSDGAIVIAATVSLTGKYASSGTNVSHGYLAAVEQVNRDGGILGRRVKLVLKDDGSQVASVGRQYTNFFLKDRVDAVLSPYGSALAGPAAQLADRFQTPMAHSLTSSPGVFTGLHYSVQAGLPPSQRVLADVPAFAVRHGLTRITLVNNDLDAFSEICDGVAAKISAAGATTVSRQSYAATTSDFSSVALKVQQGDPQVVVECSAIQDSIGLTRALDQQGFRPKMLVSATADDPSFSGSLGALSERAMGYSIWSPALGLTGAEEFEQSFTATYGMPPGNPSAAAYAAVQVLTGAMTAAGSTDHDAVAAALHDRSYPTVVGTYAVDADGVQTGYTPVLEQYQDGDYTIVAPAGPASVDVRLPY